MVERVDGSITKTPGGHHLAHLKVAAFHVVKIELALSLSLSRQLKGGASAPILT
jgi:hypothetical protein